MKSIMLWVLRIIAALLMLQSLFFKFSASPESVYIFSTLGIEPWGRIFTGVIELIASVLILIPKTTVYGAVIAFGVMAGAVFSHLTKLGVEVMGDHGQLFIYALLVMISSAILIFYNRKQLPAIFNNIFLKNI